MSVSNIFWNDRKKLQCLLSSLYCLCDHFYNEDFTDDDLR